jgi:hypothetical protein
MPRNTEKQKVCYRAECKEVWRKKTIQSRFLGNGSILVSSPLEKPIKTHGFEPVSDGLAGWKVVGESSPNALHCATVPDGPGNEWKGGEFDRIEAKNRAALKSHFAKLAGPAIIQLQHMPLNIQGGYRPLKIGPVIPGFGYDRYVQRKHDETGR